MPPSLPLRSISDYASLTSPTKYLTMPPSLPLPSMWLCLPQFLYQVSACTSLTSTIKYLPVPPSLPHLSIRFCPCLTHFPYPVSDFASLTSPIKYLQRSILAGICLCLPYLPYQGSFSETFRSVTDLSVLACGVSLVRQMGCGPIKCPGPIFYCQILSIAGPFCVTI